MAEEEKFGIPPGPRMHRIKDRPFRPLTAEQLMEIQNAAAKAWDNKERFLIPPIGPTQYDILSATLWIDPPTTARKIKEWLKEQDIKGGSRPMNNGQLQGTLDTLSNLGWLEKTLGKKGQHTLGRAPFLYSLTPMGAKMLDVVHVYLDTKEKLAGQHS